MESVCGKLIYCAFLSASCEDRRVFYTVCANNIHDGPVYSLGLSKLLIKIVKYSGVARGGGPNIDCLSVEIGSVGSQTDKISRATRVCVTKWNIFRVETCLYEQLYLNHGTHKC